MIRQGPRRSPAEAAPRRPQPGPEPLVM